jgi:hypothetical protein
VLSPTYGGQPNLRRSAQSTAVSPIYGARPNLRLQFAEWSFDQAFSLAGS